MIRWWDSSDAALAALARVDDSDVAQGVGTALLGYHALAKSMLADLPGSTLVDPALVWARLEQLDLEPVAKALGAATAPLMGEAAARYGEVLAADVHEQSLQGLETLMAQMGATGLPMPMVIERAVEVVGVPARHMGAYAKIVKTPVVTPVVKADAADRALMLYAAHLGAREATGPVPVVEGEVSKIAFKEQEHPRDADGQFALKTTDPERERRERLARKKRKNARRGVAAAAVDSAVAAEAQSRAQQVLHARSLADLAALVRAPQVREQQTRGQQVRDQQAQGQRVREQQTRAVEAAKPQAAPRPKPVAAPRVPFVLTQDVPPNPDENVKVWDFDYAYREQSMLVPASVARVILENGGFTTAMLEEKYGVTTALFAAENGRDKVWQHAAAKGYLDVNDVEEDLVLLTFDGELPVADGDPNAHEGVRLASNSQWQVDSPDGLEETWDAPPDPSWPDGHMLDQIPQIRLRLRNYEDFEDAEHHIFKAAPHHEAWSTGDVWVARNEVGEFAVEDAPTKSPDQARRERMARKRRKRARAAAGLRLVESTPAVEQPVQPVQQTREQRIQGQRVRDQAVRTPAREVNRRVLERRGLVAAPVQAPPKPRRRSSVGLSEDQLAFASFRTSMMSFAAARNLVEGFDDVVEDRIPRSQPVYVQDRSVLDAVGAKPDEHTGRLRELLSDYIEGASGHAKVEDIDFGFPSKQDAVVQARELRELADEVARETRGEAPVYLPYHDPKQGWGVRSVSHDPDPQVAFYGDPKAMKAFEAGDVELDLEVVAEHTDDLARHHHVGGMLGDQAVRIMAVRVSLPHDGDQT